MKDKSIRGSVDLDGGVDLPDEHVGGVEADGSCEQPEGQNHQGGVTEVEERWDELHDVQLRGHRGQRQSSVFMNSVSFFLNVCYEDSKL